MKMRINIFLIAIMLALAAESGGADAVSIGTANFREPYTTVKTIVGIEKYMERHGIEDIHEIIGCVE